MSDDAARPGSGAGPEPKAPTTGPTSNPTTNTTETNLMSTHDDGRTDPTADPVTDPMTDPTIDPLADPTGTAANTSAGTSAGSTAGPTADPGLTTQIPSTSTQALPARSPFRVEPSSPVPDDVVAPGSELPHLPPPAAPEPAEARSLPPHPAPQPVRRPAPRPTIVTVRKGPRPATVMLGLLTALVAAYLLLANLAQSDVRFAVSGPTFLGAFGGILLLVGLAGVVAGRLRRR